MKLTLEHQPVNFAVLYSRLLDLVRQRIQSGEFSETGLAKLLGVSQPQLSNVLKGVRRLRVPLADAMLAKFQVTPFDLFTEGEILSKLENLESLDPYNKFPPNANHGRSQVGEHLQRLRQRHRPNPSLVKREHET